MNPLDTRQLYKIKESVRRTEAQYAPAPPPGTNPIAYLDLWAYSGTGISPAAQGIATDGYGNPLRGPDGGQLPTRIPSASVCALYSPDSDGTLVPLQIFDPSADDPSNSPLITLLAPVLNWSANPIAAGVFLALRTQNNKFYIVAADCPPPGG